MLGSPAATGPGGGGGGGRPTALWPPPPPASIIPTSHHPHHLHHHPIVSSGIATSVGAAPLAAPACISNATNTSTAAAEAFSRYGLYSVFPGGGAAAAGAFYSHAAAATAGAYGRPPTAATYHAQHKLVSETAGCYTFGAPTPPPGSPYSPLPVTHLELLAKTFNNNSIIIQQPQQQQPQDYSITGSCNNNNNQHTLLNNNNNISKSANNNHIIAAKKDNVSTLLLNGTQAKQVPHRLTTNEQTQLQKRWKTVNGSVTLPLSVKIENNPTQTTQANVKRTCGCRNNNNSLSQIVSSPTTKTTKYLSIETNGGCSRTNPWTPGSTVIPAAGVPSTPCSVLTTAAAATFPSSPAQQLFVGSCGTATEPQINSTQVQVKREPATTPACQVAEITTSNNTIVKVEAISPNSSNNSSTYYNSNSVNNKISPTSSDNSPSSIVQTTMSSITTCTTGNGTIPVGIAVARQRLQQEIAPTLQSTGGLLTTAPGPGQIKEIDSASVAAAAAMTVGVTNGGGGPIIQCGDDRTNNIASWPIPPSHSSSLTAPTLWQYPAPVPMEPMLPVPVPVPPVGFQLVRDPTTGHFFVIPTTSFDQLQQAVVWPSYPQPSSHVLLPPIPPPPLAPLQLLGSTTSDYLTTASTTLHQHTQTHSTRLVALTTDTNKRKIPLPAHTLIKIESDCATPEQTTKTLQTVSTMATNSGTAVFADQSITPLLTTHVFYQHPTNLIQISQPPVPTEAVCRSQATSPVACLTPPPESSIHSETEDNIPCVQDASNQTDTPICSEDDSTTHNIPDRDSITSSPTGEKTIDEISSNSNVHRNDLKLITISSQPSTTPPVQQQNITDLKIPLQMPSTTLICTPQPNESCLSPIHITQSTAITTQITEVRPCATATITTRLSPIPPDTSKQSSAKIVEIVEPESSTKEVDSTTNDHDDEDGGDEVVSTTTTTTTPYPNVDISGLELLSNSIVELENYQKSIDTTPIKIEKDLDVEYEKSAGEDVVKKIADMSLTDVDVQNDKSKKSNDTTEVNEQNEDLGGLGLLCALAEQRIMEEVTEKSKCEVKKPVIKFEPHMDIDCKKKLKRCLEERYSLEGKSKKFKVGDFEFERKPDIKPILEDKIIKDKVTEVINNKVLPTNQVEKKDDKLICDGKVIIKPKIEKVYDEQEPEAKKHCCNNGDWSKMNALEKNMRMRLAELERQCSEKEKELSKLTPQVQSEVLVKKPLKKSKSKSLDYDRRSLSPPKLEKPEPIVIRNTDVELLKPPVLNTHKDYCRIKINSENNVYSDSDIQKQTHKRKLSLSPSEVLSDSTPSEKMSSSKKRKVGRPKKLSTPDLCEATEMIVAKKPKNLVGYLLAAKSRLHSQSRNCLSSSSPPRYHTEDSPSPKPKCKSHKKSKSASKSGKKKKSSDKKRDKHKSSSKIRPKLKAEPKVKLFIDEEENSSNDWSHDSSSSKIDDAEEVVEDAVDDNKDEQGDELVNEENEPNDIGEGDETQTIQKDNRCTLTAEHLEIDKLRVLTSMGGLFYAGVLSAIQAPDVYAITLDGERGNRPHIMSREEILRDAILEVQPATTEELLPGTRLCAYWSQQYRCLYPGTVAEPGTPDPTLDHRFVCVEFDDGDSGRIALEDIRLLQPDYPIVEYDPNPLLSLSKRKRRTSINSNIEDRRQNLAPANITAAVNASIEGKSNSESKVKSQEIVRNNNNNNNEIYAKQQRESKKHREKEKEHKERKRQKKHRREKKALKEGGEEKKRKKKHKCCDDNCNKHRRHRRKHHKHRKHHRNNDEKEKVIEETTSLDIISPEDIEDERNLHDEQEQSVNEEPEQSVEPEEEIEQTEQEEEQEQSISEQEQQEENDEETDEQNDYNDADEEEDNETSEEQDEQDENIPEPEEIKTVKDKPSKKGKKVRERQESVESRSIMAAFLPAVQLWGWSGKGYKRPGAKGRARKQFYKTIQRGKETISVGDAAVFLSTGRPDRPYIGRIEAMWESWGNNMVVKVKWFYHPEETVGGPLNLKYPGALFESPHLDENDVQTISHKCEVLPLKEYIEKLGTDPQRYKTVYENNDFYYRAGYYDPTTNSLRMEPDIPIKE